MPCVKQGGVCVCVFTVCSCSSLLLQLLIKLKSSQVFLPSHIWFLTFYLYPVCLFVCMFCSLVSKPGASTETAWLIGEGWGLGGRGYGGGGTGR